MKYRHLLIPVIACLLGVFLGWFFLSLPSLDQEHSKSLSRFQKKHEPCDQFFLMRSWPEPALDLQALEQSFDNERKRISTFKTLTFEADWQQEGPGNIGGRVNALAVHPVDQEILYAGTPSGGVFKTTDGGDSWEPVFDDHNFLSVSDIALDPSDPEVVYVGTGDANISGYPFIGDGVHKSSDGGQTWSHLGLEETRVISKIIVHPTSSEIIYVGAMGLPFERNDDRGVYKSMDGGVSWQQVLFVSDSAGVIDLLIDPNNPETLYAASWVRIRNNQESIASGWDSRIHKTTDGGQTWSLVWNGLPDVELSRIGLAMSGINSSKVYACLIDSDYFLEGIYVSQNGGDNWNALPSSPDPSIVGGFGWYFGKMYVDPTNDDNIYVDGVQLHKTNNGGQSWQSADPSWWEYDVHADKHDLIFLTSGSYIIATDGGIYRTDNDGETWSDIENLPITQFYHVAVNPHSPGIYYGGAQDNGTCSGNASGINSWMREWGGDGFSSLFHPTNPEIYVYSSQYGAFVINDPSYGIEDFTAGIDFNDRVNWDAPITISKHNSDVYYTGTHRMYKTGDGVNPNWEPISNDLTDGDVFGPIFHTISTLDESPVDAQVLYAGTSDGNVWSTTDGGSVWNNVSAGLPKRYVTCVRGSYTTPNRVFVSHSGYKYNEFIPRIHRSDDHGNQWEDISSDLPDFAINDIEIYPLNDSIIALATDGGVYTTLNAGVSWQRVGGNMPLINVYDVDFDLAQGKLIAGTFARSMLSYSLDSLFETGTQVSFLPSLVSSARLQLFPNPVQEYLTVMVSGNFEMEGVQIKVMNLHGENVLSPYTVHSNRRGIKIPVRELSKGVYFLKIEGQNHRLSEKFIKL